jgi:putative ABC transport system permease protein
LEALKIPILRGRGFDRSDLPTSLRVAIVNENFARQFFSREDPIGRTIRIVVAQDGGRFYPGEVRIVGVAANTKEVGLDEVDFESLYVPLVQNPLSEVMLAVRTTGDATAVSAALRREVAAFDPNQPVNAIVPMEQQISASLSENRLHMLLAAVFASVALLLAGIGIYAVLAYSIAQRIREIGIRMALGAQRSGVLALVLRHCSRLLLPGLALGIALTLVLGQILNSMLYLVRYEHDGLLYGVSTHDPLLLAAAAVFLTCLALLASIIPARGATRVDPIAALRNE